MARKPVEVLHNGLQHEHCTTCGSCLIQGAQIHRCYGEAMRPDILEVFKMDMRPHDTAWLRQTIPSGFHIE